MGIDSIIRKIGIFALAGLVSIVASCAPLSRKQYIAPSVGMVAPVLEEEEKYQPHLMIGATYGVSGNPYGIGKEKIGLEVSLDYFKTSGENIKTDSFLLGVNATYPVRFINPAVYLTGGLAFLNEFSTIDIPAPFNVHDRQSDTTVGLGFGANMRFDAADIEDVSARLSYIILFISTVAMAL